MLKGRLRTVVAAFGLAALSGGCGTNAADGITPDSARTTDTFTGTVQLLGAAASSFNVVGNGNLEATLTALGPQTSITMGFGVGQPGGTGCGLISYTESARVGSVVSGTVAPGTFCVQIYDLGNLTAPATYTITVVHP